MTMNHDWASKLNAPDVYMVASMSNELDNYDMKFRCILAIVVQQVLVSILLKELMKKFIDDGHVN